MKDGSFLAFFVNSNDRGSTIFQAGPTKNEWSVLEFLDLLQHAGKSCNFGYGLKWEQDEK